MSLLRQELEIHKGELLENLHFASLEKIFIEERIYKEVKFEQSENTDAACEFIDTGYVLICFILVELQNPGHLDIQ